MTPTEIPLRSPHNDFMTSPKVMQPEKRIARGGTTEGMSAWLMTIPELVTLIAGAQFPSLQQTVRGGSLAHPDSAATAQKPQAALDALMHHCQRARPNAHRAVHTLATRAAPETTRHSPQRFASAAAAKGASDS